MASVGFRARPRVGERSFRRRRDSEDENITLDWSRASSVNLYEILSYVVRKDGVSKGQKLGYLNCFTKFCSKVEDISYETVGFALDEIYCCLRVVLFHEAPEVRASGLRAMRYLLRDEEAVESLCRVNLPLLIVRSMDIVLENKLERLQAVRLIRKLMSLDPKRFPPAMTRCLVSIAKDGAAERDMLYRTCWAMLAELTLLNPFACAEAGGMSAILSSVLHPNQSHHISEALISSILYLLNSPRLRPLLREDLDLQYFVAPLTDCYPPPVSLSSSHKHVSGAGAGGSLEQREAKFIAARSATISVLRSWPGLVFMCRDLSEVKEGRGLNGLESLIATLHLPYPDVRKHILELIFELFYLQSPGPKDPQDFHEALHSCNPSAMQEPWQLNDGFVSAEGKALLPHVVQIRQSLVDNYLAILLYSFICYGILDALVSVIINPKNVCNSIRATILLGELLHLTSQLLPPEMAQKCHSLPRLVQAGTSSESSLEQRDIACAAVFCLSRMHALKKYPVVPCSLYLDQIIQFSAPSKRKTLFENTVSKTKLRHFMRKEGDDVSVGFSIRDSLVLSQELYWNWDLDLVASILKWPSDNLKRFEDNNSKNFIRKLVNFFKPSFEQFSQIDSKDDRERELAIVGCHLFDFLLEAEEAKAFEYLEEFLADLCYCFSQITVDNPEQNAILSHTRLISTLSHYYFLFVGRLSCSNKGKKLLEKAGIYQCLLELVALTAHEEYMKLIVSSLDYTKDGSFCRTLLTNVLTCSNEKARLYATNYMRVLLRVGITDFKKWALELLIQQLYDQSSSVSLAAIEILDEACDHRENLEALIVLRPSLLHIGDNGLLLLIRYFSSPNGFKYLKEASFLNHELDRWRSIFNLKYVKIVEDLLNETLTYHKRSEDGTYGRRSDKKNVTYKKACLPPHLYGQLAQHEEGIKIISQEESLSQMYSLIRSPDFETDSGIFHLKAALWAVGQVGSTLLGVQLLVETEIIPSIVTLAAEAPVLSIRGTCFYVLGLLSSTDDGADILEQYGWEAIRHRYGEKWPLVKDNPIELTDSLTTRKQYSWSISSAGTRSIYSTKKPFSSAHSINEGDQEDFEESSHENAFSSLPALDDQQGEMRFKSVSQSQGQKQLLRVASLSPQHCMSSLDSRPRSSSDFHPKSNGGGVLDIEDSDDRSGIWLVKTVDTTAQATVVADRTAQGDRHDSGFDTVDDASPAFHPLSTISKQTVSADKVTPRRKISEPGYASYGHFSVPSNPIKGERSDSNESSGKSRSGSYNDSTSGVSSCASSSATTFIGATFSNRTNRLSPIASISSITNPLTSIIPSGYFTLPRQGSATSPTGRATLIISDSIPSVADAFGYAQLKAIQRRRRVQSLAQHSSLDLSPDDSDDEENILLQSYGGFSANSFSFSRRSSSIRHQDEEQNVLIAEPVANFLFMALCIPTSLTSIFVAPVNKSETEEDGEGAELPPFSWKTHLDRLSDENISANNGLELHKESNCILCFAAWSSRGPLISISVEEEISVPKEVLKPLGGAKKLLDVEPQVHSASSFTSSSSVEGGTVSPTDSLTSHILIRREILRFVTNLSGSVAAKAAEQGLLNLKQRYPQAFQDICLYSEICLQLASYNFRLSARRFLQELFLDVTFAQLFQYAETILSTRSSVIGSGGASSEPVTASSNQMVSKD